MNEPIYLTDAYARDSAAKVIAITDEGNHSLDDKCEYIIPVPQCDEILMPLMTVIPTQLMAYYIADMRKCNVDQPRNLAKSVTVE